MDFPVLAYRKLTPEELESCLATLPGWSVENGQITKQFEFKSYASGLAFACAAGFVADKLDHHPDLYIGYLKVRVSMNTHDVGGLSPYDLELARNIEAIA
jgi:4a-hydroxytetrahydrobiopterin dehydratase